MSLSNFGKYQGVTTNKRILLQCKCRFSRDKHTRGALQLRKLYVEYMM